MRSYIFSLIFLSLWFQSVGYAQNSPDSLHVFSANIIKVNAQILSVGKAMKGESAHSIGGLIDEIVFNCNFRIELFNELNDGVGFSFTSKPFRQIIKCQEAVLDLLSKIPQQDSLILNKVLAKKIGAASDSLFHAFDRFDASMKATVDTLYIHATSINNEQTRREVTTASRAISQRIYVMLSLSVPFLALLFFFVKTKRNSSLLIAGFCILLLLGVFYPQIVKKIGSEKKKIPFWETETRYGNHLYNAFIRSCKSASDVDRNTLGAKAIKQYYKAVYITPAPKVAKQILTNTLFINSILYPPIQAPDTVIGIFDTINIDFKPQWFSTHNYTKIKSWNKMLSRGNIRGEEIDLKNYTLSVSKIAQEDIMLCECHRDTLMATSVAKWMQPALLTKLKCIY